MSRTQLEHMFQQSYSRSFSMYQDSDTFQESYDPMAIDVSGIDMPTANIYVMDNGTCDTAVNRGVFDMMAGTIDSVTLSGVTTVTSRAPTTTSR